MAYTTINKPSEYFNTVLYTGNATGRTISGVGFQPDWTWIKNRSDTSGHRVLDVVRGGTKELIANGTNAEITEAQSLQSWNSDGFVLGTAAGVNANTDNFVSWNWKANGAGVSNTDGDINSTVSANTTSGFSIVNYTGTLSGSGNPTVGHGLGVAPAVIIIKSASSGENWGVQHTSLPANYLLQLNTTSAQIDSASQGTLTAPTSSVFTVNYSGEWGNSGQNYIAYCFAEKKGFSKFGSYVGNGSTNGVFCYTGFKPAFIITKKTSATDNWILLDNKRDIAPNPHKLALFPNLADAEAGDYLTDFLSNGFKIRSATGSLNTVSASYIYMAFAENPLVGTNNIPATAR